MKKSISISLPTIPSIALAYVMVLLSGCALGLRPLPNTVEEQLKDAVDHGMDGVIVCVNRPGEIQLYAAGWKNREDQIPADPNALFKIASISKLYIAAATILLISEEKLSLDQTLGELIPEVEGKIEYANEITLKMMIQHRSGLLDYSFEPEVAGESFVDHLSFAARIYDKPAVFKPNKKYGYSNSNYLLIGEILDRTLGYSHHKYIREEILEPLGLKNTYNVPSEVDMQKVMSGYLKSGGSDLRDLEFPLPGGSMIATAEDVSIFLRALIDGTLFSPDEQAIYTSVYPYEHTGWLPGYTSIARYHSEMDAVVVQFVSTSGKEIYWLRLKSVYKRTIRILKNKTEI
ncbi:MAG: serine hydrolase domain-containing protein [Reichenbachiella sp.]|uniref:serine hydrolase domain-containing protein n=1 Tax=Reichenbachiella sp. TaxID=2184521 RepID=UPI00296693C6|nr:serine hydrolase domain-containing protein [Reichenbachiella sp.]MDW3210037.1 serine hydrolase domain-containing protein [Reichenbachiella sp.]